MALLDSVAWEGKIFNGGTWTDGRGGTYPVVEPATGNELGTMGQADAEDVAEAAASAAEAQKEWAALPHTARAAVLPGARRNRGGTRSAPRPPPRSGGPR